MYIISIEKHLINIFPNNSQLVFLFSTNFRLKNRLCLVLYQLETMEKIEAKAKVILQTTNTTNALVNAGNGNDKTNGNANNLNNDRSNTNRNGEIIVLQHYSEERVISLTILGILFSLLILIAISFIYIYICKKYFRKDKFIYDNLS